MKNFFMKIWQWVPVAGALFALAGLGAPIVHAATAAPVQSPYLYTWNDAGVLVEAGSFLDSTSRYWWVDSGAYLDIWGGTGHTNQGSLPATDPWRVLYAANNPVDTDNGYHPQNLFRLLTQSNWQNMREEAYFFVNARDLSASSNRNQSNGLLLFSHYVDHNDLYYAGIRVDGSAVIKKKQNGIYYTLALTPGTYPGTYNHDTNPNLIPMNQWIGLRTETVDRTDGSVAITLYMDKSNNGTWTKVASAVDSGTKFGSAPITANAHGGIRTDFMDVTFENFRITTL